MCLSVTIAFEDERTAALATMKNLDRPQAGSGGTGDERRLLPMLIGGLILVLIGMVVVMVFV